MNPVQQAARPGTMPPGTRVYAVGDVHGQLPLLQDLHEVIRRDLDKSAPQRAVVVYLGDYVDRGSESCGVLELLSSGHGLPDGLVERVHLAGNHEDMMLTALDPAQAGTARGAGLTMTWLQNGGVDTLTSYGVKADTATPFTQLADSIRTAMAKAMPASHRAFLDALKLYHQEGGYLFVHAGIRPGIPLERQSREDLFWIRKDFLDCREPHPFVVVHGHTPCRLPQMLDNRICVDTGAFATGRLTCGVFEGSERRLLNVNGRPV